MKLDGRIVGTGTAPAILALLVLLLCAFTSVRTQQPQIPASQVCNPTTVRGEAWVTIASRAGGGHAGTFSIDINVTCPAPSGSGYPTGSLRITVDMNDSLAQGVITAADTDLEQVTSTGKASPTAYISGRCKAHGRDNKPISGCRFWLMLANNKKPNAEKAPDVVGFLVLDGNGKRIAYGTGPVDRGDINIAPTSN